MSMEFAEMTFSLPVTQYVKVEAEAAESSVTAGDLASFLLTEWVNATCARQEYHAKRKGEAR